MTLPNACPKPRKKAKPAPRYSSIREKTFEEKLIAAKKLKQNARPIPAKNVKRRRSEFARCFHSKARVEFVKSLACCATGRFATPADPIDNAHVCDDGSKGAGRRSGYACIAPLKRSAHRLLHVNPRKFREKFGHFNWSAMAAYTDAQWENFSGVSGGAE